DRVAVENARVTEVDALRPVGPGAGGNDEVIRTQHRPFAAQADGVGVDEAGQAIMNVDAVFFVVTASQIYLFINNMRGMLDKLVEVWLAQRGTFAQQRIAAELHDLLDHVPQRLGGDGAQMGTIASYLLPVGNDGNPPAFFGRVHGGRFTRRTAADDDDVVLLFLLHC